MSQEKKISLLEVVDFAAQKLNITSKGKLYLELQGVLESHVADDDDWLEAAKPRVVIHKAPNLCLACEG